MPRPFNLEEFKAGQPARNRNGELRYYVGTTREGAVVVEDEHGYVSRLALGAKPQDLNAYDLVSMVPRLEKRWVVTIKDNTSGREWLTLLCTDHDSAVSFLGRVGVAGLITEVEIEV